MSFLSKFGSFASSLFGGAKAETPVAKRHGTFAAPTAGKSHGATAAESAGRLRDTVALTTEDYNQAMKAAIAKTKQEIEDKMRGTFGTKTPVKPKTPSLYDIAREEEAQEARDDMARRRKYIDEEQRRNMTPELKFLYGDITHVTSTNVDFIQYDRERNMLYIGYHNGAWYVYYDIDANEASSLFNAPSKGGWVWDNLRVRKTVWGYKREYAFLEYRLEGGYMPRYLSDEGYAAEHAAIPPSGEPPAGWKIAGNGPYADLPWYNRSPGEEAKKHQLPVAKLFEEPKQEKRKRA